VNAVAHPIAAGDDASGSRDRFSVYRRRADLKTVAVRVTGHLQARKKNEASAASDNKSQHNPEHRHKSPWCGDQALASPQWVRRAW
jgi:hypothetical protein